MRCSAPSFAKLPSQPASRNPSISLCIKSAPLPHSANRSDPLCSTLSLTAVYTLSRNSHTGSRCAHAPSTDRISPRVSASRWDCPQGPAVRQARYCADSAEVSSSRRNDACSDEARSAGSFSQNAGRNKTRRAKSAKI